MTRHKIATREEWLTARLELLEAEKELTRRSDELARRRQALPWVRLDKAYRFETREGTASLADLFGGRHQLLVQHFMLGPGWEQGCPSCSFMADHADGMLVHLAHRDTSFAAISRAPLVEIERYRKRMGWRFQWASSYGSDFNRDFGVSFTPDEVAAGELRYNYRVSSSNVNDELPGISAFYRDDDGTVFHTYSAYGRGVEVMMGTYRMLDLTSRGRDERDVPNKMEWVRRHDEYHNRPGEMA